MVIFKARVPCTNFRVPHRRLEEFDAAYAANFEAFVATDHESAAKFACHVRTEAIEATSRTNDGAVELFAGDSEANFHVTAARAVFHAEATALATQVASPARDAHNTISESSTDL